MADVEESYDEEVHQEEEEIEEAPQTPTTPKRREPPPVDDGGVGEDGMTETERAIWARKKKFAEQEDQEIQEYLEQRAVEMEQMTQEIEELKERQQERRQERQEEMERMLEMQRANEEQRKADEEERKARLEADKRKKEADRKRKLQMMAGGGIAGLHTTDGKPNYVVQKKEDVSAGGPEVPVSAPGQSQEEAKAAKEQFLARFQNVPEFESMDLSELRMRVKGMHEQIARAEAAKYDMEERMKTQEYDLKELRERAKQQARQKAIKKGLDPEEYANAKHPPKKAVASKFDRQTDRRSYGDRREMFDKCLRIDGRPVIPPPKAIFHGSCKPPEDFGRPAAKNEELEQLRKNLEPPKYSEAAPVEGAKPPIQAVPAGPVPEDDEVGNIPPQPRGELRGQDSEQAPAEAEPAAAEEEEE